MRRHRNHSDLRQARVRVDALAVLRSRTKDESRELEELSKLIEKYEVAQREVETGDFSPIEAIRYLMEGHDMSASDLGRLLGNRDVGAPILRGDQQLSKTHVEILSKRFVISAELFTPKRRAGDAG